MFGVARAIPFFVVVASHFNRFVEVARIKRVACIVHNLLEDSPAFCRVALHDGKFFIGEFTILVQNQVRDRDFTDVMERSGLLEFADVAIVQDALELAFGAQFLRNRFDIFSSLFDVVASVLVARFNEFREFRNHHVLHFLDSKNLVAHLFNKALGVLGHRIEMVVQLADFITCINLEVLHIRNGILNQRKIELAHFKRHRRTHRSPGNFHGGMRHLVHRHHKAVLHHLNNHHHNNQRETKEERQQLDKEHGLVAHNGFHRDIGCHVGNGVPRCIFYRPVNGEEPAKLVIRNNRLDFLARQKLRQIGFKRGVKFHQGARSATRYAIRIEVKYHVTTIRQNLVHIHVLCLREAFTNTSKHITGMSIAFDLITLRYVIVHLFGINCNRCRFGHTPCDTDKIIDAVVTIQEEPDHARKPAQKDFGDNHHDHDLVQQGMANCFFIRRKSLVGILMMEQLDIFKFVLDMTRNKSENKSRQKNNGTLVKNVNYDISKKLRIKTVPVQNVVERNRERRRDALAKIEPVQSICKDGTDTTANQRKEQYDYEQFPDMMEESSTKKECRKRRN